MTVYCIGDDLFLVQQVFPTGEECPRLVHAFVIRDECPLVVDSGYPPRRAELMADLRSILDPAEIAYVAVTHADPDHSGGLPAILEAAPHASVLTNEIGKGKLAGDFGLDDHCFQVLDPGSGVSLGSRTVFAHPVPLFDQAETTGFFDDATRTFFTADCFGAVVPGPVTFADEISEADHRSGFNYWNRANHPWVRMLDPVKFGAAVERVRRLHPRALASTHGPVIRYQVERAFSWLEALVSDERNGEMPSIQAPSASRRWRR